MEPENNLDNAQPVFVKTEEFQYSEKEVDHSKEFTLPSIKVRYFSTLIDFLLLFFLSGQIARLYENIGEVSGWVRGLTFVVVFMMYEPVLVSLGCTLGQLITNIRVRRIDDPSRRIPVYLSVPRTIIKGLLGWFSFLSMGFDVNRRAVHEYLSKSIVIIQKS